MSNLTTTKQKSISSQVQQESLSEFINTKVSSIMTSKVKERFITGIVSAVNANPQLAECTRLSIVNCALLGEALKFSPSPTLGHYYMLPFKKKAKKDVSGNIIEPEAVIATFIPGYKGYIQLAIRSAQYKDIDCFEIREGEYKGRDPFTGKGKFEFIEDEEMRLNAPIVGYMAYFELLNGFRKVIYWSKEKVLKHANDYSPAFSANDYKRLLEGKIAEKDMWKYSSYWYKDFDGMAFKTLIRQLISKWGIMSIEMQIAFEKDIEQELKQDQFIGNEIQTEINEKKIEIDTKEPIENATEDFLND